MADDDTDTDSLEIEETEELIETDGDEYYDILDVVDELDWCPSDGSVPHNVHKAEICKMINEIGDLDNQLNANTDALAENAKNMKDKEQSFENRMLGAVGIGTVGIGGMMAASALAEQSADADAARDMDAYLATMQCRVGDNVYKLGDAGIDVGGTNQLTELYQQYVDLAADLKERKTALGMKSGIESQVVMDSAKMGLYDDKGNGIENGTYASLYRASRGNEKDVNKINEQQESASKNLKIGAGVAIAGAAATAIANYAINHNNKDKSKELLEEREKVKSRFNEIKEQMVRECNALIQEHKDFAKTLSAEQLTIAEWAEYKQAVDAAQPITNIIEIKDSKFCK